MNMTQLTGIICDMILIMIVFLFPWHDQRVTPLDLISVANELESEANLLPPTQIEHATNLKNIAIMLESYQLKVISKVHHSVVSILIIILLISILLTPFDPSITI